jgi:hypothetical protein
MIWFACKQCGKRHGRSDDLVGTMVFCDCGSGNLVPWASTLEAPEPMDAEEAPMPLPLPPRTERIPPLPAEHRPAPRRPQPSRPVPPEAPQRTELPESEAQRQRQRRREARRINSLYCLNHEDTPSEKTCDDCRVSFCSACVLQLQGKTLCGPCKNFRLRSLSRPPRLAPKAIVALIVSLVGGPVTFCLSAGGAGLQVNGTGPPALTVLMILVGLLLPAGGLILSALALRDIETRPHVGGRALAMTGATTALVGILWSLTVGILVLLKHSQG